jgi:hypothetical protein
VTCFSQSIFFNTSFNKKSLASENKYPGSTKKAGILPYHMPRQQFHVLHHRLLSDGLEAVSFAAAIGFSVFSFSS